MPEVMSAEQRIARYHETGDSVLRDQLVREQMPLARMVARKFEGRGVEYDDLFQVACFALVKAMDRFDAERGLKFSTYVVPNMVGEVKNYFRDKSRTIRLPRSSAEAMRRLTETENLLHQELRRHPSAAELAETLGWSVEDVLETVEIRHASSVDSLDRPVDEDSQEIGELHGVLDQGMLDYENRDMLRRALSQLDPDEVQLLQLRYFANKSQRDVAQLLGISQMTVSRREKRALAELRKHISEEDVLGVH